MFRCGRCRGASFFARKGSFPYLGHRGRAAEANPFQVGGDRFAPFDTRKEVKGLPPRSRGDSFRNVAGQGEFCIGGVKSRFHGSCQKTIKSKGI